MLAFIFWGAVPASAEKRVALVIGNAAYSHAAPLKNPKNDAEALAGVLEGLGFEVVRGTDLTYAAMRRSVRDYAHKLQGAEVALLFYAGHGLQVNGKNYLAPVDAQLRSEVDLEYEAIRVESILTHMEGAAKTNIVLLDACRDNPLARNLARSMGTRSASIGRGLARVETGVGTLIAFATQPGNVAYDGDGANSPFTTGLLKHIETPGMDVQLVMRRVRQEVIEATKGTQVPWDNSSLTSNFYFKAKAAEETPAARAAPLVDDRAIELAFWQSAKEQGTKEAYEVYLERFPQGAFAPLAELQIGKFSREDAARSQKASAMDAERKKQEALRAAEIEAAKKKSEEERLRQIAEAERLAKEKEALEKRLAAYEMRLRAEAEARAKALAEETTKAGGEDARTQVAAIDPQASAGVRPDLADPRELAVALQTQLKRVGCDPGDVDGKWGPKGRKALENFAEHAKVKLSVLEPSQELIDALKARTQGRICPLACGPLEVLQGDRCVPRTCGAGQALDRSGRCVAVAARTPAPAVPRKPDESPAGRTKEDACASLDARGASFSIFCSQVRDRETSARTPAPAAPPASREKKLPECSEATLSGNPAGNFAVLGGCRR
ncbi:MAG: caspase family protein [Hyphomicrobiales bacterium]